MNDRAIYSVDDLRAVINAASGDFAGTTLAEHVSEALGLLRPVVEHTSFLAYLVQREGPVVTPLCSNGIDDQGMNDYPRHYIHFDPMQSTFGDPSATVATLSGCARRMGVDLSRNPYVAEFTLPRFKISHILGSNFLIDGRATLTFSMHRERSLQDFGDRELNALKIVLPHLTRALRVTHARVQSLEMLRRASGDDSSPREQETSGVATLDRALEIGEATIVARRVLAEMAERGDMDEVLTLAATLIERLERDGARTFADASLVRALERGLATIRVVAMRMSPGGTVSSQIFVDIVRSKDQPLIAHFAGRWKLTPREVEIVALLHEGLTQKGIAERLEIADWTVRNHLMTVRQKLAVRSNAQILTRLLGMF